MKTAIERLADATEAAAEAKKKANQAVNKRNQTLARRKVIVRKQKVAVVAELGGLEPEGEDLVRNHSFLKDVEALAAENKMPVEKFMKEVLAPWRKKRALEVVPPAASEQESAA